MKEVKPSYRRILFIINTHSGTGRRANLEKALSNWLDASKFQWEIVFTEYAGHATELAKQAVVDRVDFVVSVGGDGTANEVGQSLVGSETVMGIIPTGSGNGLARHLGIPMNLMKAIRIFNNGKIKKIDTATIDGQFFLNIAGVGFDAHVAKKFGKASTRGFFTYLKIVISSYRQYRPKKYKITFDGTSIKRRALLVSFANSNQFGNNTSIDPYAKIDDGLIDLCIVGRPPLWKVTLLSPLLFIRKFDKTSYVEIYRAKEVELQRKKGKVIHLDGDPHEFGKKISLRMKPLSLKVIVP